MKTLVASPICVRFWYLCSLVVLAFILNQTAFAQGGASAQLSGLVTDPNGAVVAGATVTARNTETTLSRSTQSTETGYVLTNLSPGLYEVTVEAPNFAGLRQTGVELTVGQQATLNVTLQLKGTTGTVTVESGTEVIETTRTEQSQVIEERRIENLPINGRQFLDFTLLTPNVDTGRSNASSAIRPGEPNEINISFAGLHETTSLITVDGANNMNRIFGKSRSAPSQEAVREFRVVTNGYGADLGPAAGAVVSIITKSGSNDVHGSAYYYLRHSSLDARNILAPAGFDKLKQNQFGGTLGGPLVRDRFFLFGNYEGQRREESPFYSSVLLNNLAAINAVKTSLGLSPEVLEGKLRRLNYDTLTLRGDYQPTANNQLSLVYRFRDERDKNLGAATGQLSAPSDFRDAKIRDHALVFNMASTLSSKFVNQVLFQFARRSFEFPSVSYEPHMSIANTLDMGRHFNPVDATRETRYEFGDTATYTRGDHSLKFGGNLSHVRDFFVSDLADPAFAIFPNLAFFFGVVPAPFCVPGRPCAVLFGFAAGADKSRPPAPPGFTGSANLPAFESLVTTKGNETTYSLFAQDQWRVTPKLTLNYGLRWDVDRLPKQFYDPYYKAFQPRVGVAYSAFSDRIVLRIGAGIYQGLPDVSRYLYNSIIGQDPGIGIVRPDYAIVPGGLRFPFISNPFVAAPAFLQFVQSGIYPTITGPGVLPGQDFFLATNRKNGRPPYAYQWSGQVDFRITQDMALSLGYIGVHGLNISSGCLNLNVAPALFKLPTGENDYGIGPGVPVPRLINPLVAPLSNFFDSTAQSMYHGATATLTKRFSHNYGFTINYTWSKVIDNAANEALEGQPEDPYRRDLERARSNQDVPHRLVASFTAEGPKNTWLRDFRFSLISRAESARYSTILTGFDFNNDGNPLTDRPGIVGRNTFKGDKFVNTDVRLSRVIPFSERVHLEVIGEAFNVFNTLNVTGINMVYGAPVFIGPVPRKFGEPVVAPLPSFGSIREIASPRQIQIAFRLTF